MHAQGICPQWIVPQVYLRDRVILKGLISFDDMPLAKKHPFGSMHVQYLPRELQHSILGWRVLPRYRLL